MTKQHPDWSLLPGNPAAFFSDGLESGGGNWSVASTTSLGWGIIDDFAKSGSFSLYGPDGSSTYAGFSDHSVRMTNPVTIPANARMSFDHAFEFEHDSTFFYDGGVLEYSTDGTTWTDAGSLIDAGQAYGGTLFSDNALGARSGSAAARRGVALGDGGRPAALRGRGLGRGSPADGDARDRPDRRRPGFRLRAGLTRVSAGNGYLNAGPMPRGGAGKFAAHSSAAATLEPRRKSSPASSLRRG